MSTIQNGEKPHKKRRRRGRKAPGNVPGQICTDHDLLRRRKAESEQHKAWIQAKRDIDSREFVPGHTWYRYDAELESHMGSKQDREALPHRDLPRNVDQLAQYLRNAATKSELEFLPHLKSLAARHHDSVYFQHIVGRRFIVDYYLPKLNLAIEIDGHSHAGKEERDAKRDDWIARVAGITVLRFNAYVSLINPASIIREIDEHVAKVTKYRASV